jgi:hypothetical protein
MLNGAKVLKFTKIVYFSIFAPLGVVEKVLFQQPWLVLVYFQYFIIIHVLAHLGWVGSKTSVRRSFFGFNDLRLVIDC